MTFKHQHDLPESATRFAVVIALNLFITAVEAVGDIFSAIHPYPTLSESLSQAILASGDMQASQNQKGNPQ